MICYKYLLVDWLLSRVNTSKFIKGDDVKFLNCKMYITDICGSNFVTNNIFGWISMPEGCYIHSINFYNSHTLYTTDIEDGYHNNFPYVITDHKIDACEWEDMWKV